jgi:intracellular sulfur oxidation DsrE/DsrF family protein
MTKKLSSLLCLLLLGGFLTASAQKYKAVYQLNSDDDKTIRATLRNIKNALEDPRLRNNLTIELVAHSGGVTVYRKDQPYEALLKDLQSRGVILMECENTLREKHIKKDELFPFIQYTPSGNGELIIKQQQGWAYVHP